MTEFEKLLSKYTDAEQYFYTAGFFHIATLASEIETRKLIDEIVDRAGLGDDLQKRKGDGFTRTSYTSDDRTRVGYAIPRHFYRQMDGNIEVNKIEVVWYTYRYDDEQRYPTDETETVIPITEQEESQLKELALLADTARKDYEAVKRTAISNLFKEQGLTDDDDKTIKQKLTAVRDLADGLIEAVDLQDADTLQEVQYKQITQHWQILYLTDADTRNELIRFFSTKYHEADEKSKALQQACTYSNFVNNIVPAIPESYIHDRAIIYKGRTHTREGDEADEAKQQYTLLQNCLTENRKRVRAIADEWYYKIGGEYLKEEPEKPVKDETETLQRFAESETVIQNYTSPQQQVYTLAKASRGILGDPDLAEEITLMDNGQLQFSFAVSPADAKIQRAVIVDITDNVKGLTKFDRSVFNAVGSIIEAGNTTFTSKQVAIQNTQNEKPSKNVVGAYTKSIEKMRLIIHKLDATEHLKQNGIDLESMDIDSVTKDDYLLPVEGITITMNNGTEVRGYSLKNTPLLLAYAKDVNQIHTVDIEVLNVPVRLDETTLLIRDYLIQQIGIIYNAKNRNRISNNILISTVLDYAGVDLLNLDRTQKKRHTDKIRQMLSYWNGEYIAGVEPIKNKYIENGYDLKYNGKTLEAITIRPKKK